MSTPVLIQNFPQLHFALLESRLGIYTWQSIVVRIEQGTTHVRGNLEFVLYAIVAAKCRFTYIPRTSSPWTGAICLLCSGYFTTQGLCTLMHLTHITRYVMSHRSTRLTLSVNENSVNVWEPLAVVRGVWQARPCYINHQADRAGVKPLRTAYIAYNTNVSLNFQREFFLIPVSCIFSPLMPRLFLAN